MLFISLIMFINHLLLFVVLPVPRNFASVEVEGDLGTSTLLVTQRGGLRDELNRETGRQKLINFDPLLSC